MTRKKSAKKSKKNGAAVKKKQVQTAAPENLRRAVLQAAALAGGEFGETSLVCYLQQQALQTPGSFLSLLGKALDKAEEQAPQPPRVIELVPATAAAADTGAEAAEAEAEEKS